MDVLIRSRVPSTRWPLLGLVLAAGLPGLRLPAQSAATPLSVNPPPITTMTMKSFVIIFRQERELTDADKQSRSKETAAWARQHNGAGHKLDPRILAPESEVRGVGAVLAGRPDAAWPVTALLFLEARDLEAAARIAEQHPGLRYGASIEVRPWAPPVPVAVP